MRLVFTKTNGKYDILHVERSGEGVVAIQCPKQGIIPHDMVHFAVETVVRAGGFLTRLTEGESLADTMVGTVEGDAVEGIVLCLQAELWSQPMSAEDFLASYYAACEARGHRAIPLSQDEITLLRTSIADLTHRWAAVPVQGTLVLDDA